MPRKRSPFEWNITIVQRLKQFDWCTHEKAEVLFEAERPFAFLPAGAWRGSHHGENR